MERFKQDNNNQKFLYRYIYSFSDVMTCYLHNGATQLFIKLNELCEVIILFMIEF